MALRAAASQGWIVAGEYRDVESGSHDDRRQYQRASVRMERKFAVPGATYTPQCGSSLGSARLVPQT
jgi:hypothetical protein